MGCSGAGEIAGTRVSDAGLSVAVASFDATRLELVTSRIRDGGESYCVGRRLAVPSQISMFCRASTTSTLSVPRVIW